MPRLTLTPMLATTGTALPEGLLWTYEVKWDGYRALALKDGSRVQSLSRNQKHLTGDYPSVVGAVNTVRTNTIVLDGEIAAIDDDGRPSFQALQHRSTGGPPIVYYAFDVLRIGNESLLRQTLEARRERLRLAARVQRAAVRTVARLTRSHRARDPHTRARGHHRQTSRLDV